MSKNKFCQSCGMPMSKDPAGGGLNKDGSKNEKYCSYCYQNGQFVGDFKTAKEMQVFVMDMMKKNKIPGVIAWLLTLGIPSLDRWK